MNILIVYCHPNPDSFNHGILKSVVKGLTQAGHDYQIADLYAEQFQPAMITADFAQFSGKDMPVDIQREQKRIEWSDGVIFIFPLWWWTMPAMLKGWIDRVMSYGWAWEDPSDPDSGNLRRRKILMMVTAGASEKALAKRGYDKAFHTQMNMGTWSYCNFKDITTRFFYCVNPEASRSMLDDYLDTAEELAKNVF